MLIYLDRLLNIINRILCYVHVTNHRKLGFKRYWRYQACDDFSHNKFGIQCFSTGIDVVFESLNKEDAQRNRYIIKNIDWTAAQYTSMMWPEGVWKSELEYFLIIQV